MRRIVAGELRNLVFIDKPGFVFVDGVKVARYIPERNSLQFVDRDPRRGKARGTRLVELPLAHLFLATCGNPLLPPPV